MSQDTVSHIAFFLECLKQIDGRLISVIRTSRRTVLLHDSGVIAHGEAHEIVPQSHVCSREIQRSQIRADLFDLLTRRQQLIPGLRNLFDPALL